MSHTHELYTVSICSVSIKMHATWCIDKEILRKDKFCYCLKGLTDNDDVVVHEGHFLGYAGPDDRVVDIHVRVPKVHHF